MKFVLYTLLIAQYRTQQRKHKDSIFLFVVVKDAEELWMTEAQWSQAIEVEARDAINGWAAILVHNVSRGT